ncbi:MAG: hypothetical protein FXF54_04720 [Kosmotoga sp.]|nr:MAG: hypothetical protein FXF54_04720 [Kosmotoga sp.]
MSDIRENLFNSCAEKKNGKVDVDEGYILESLLLFDNYILQSIRLEELPTLVKLFDYEGLIHLLNKGILKIFYDALTIGQTGQLSILNSRKKKGILQKGCFSFNAVGLSEKQKIINSLIEKGVDGVSELSKNEKENLKLVIKDNLLSYPKNAGNEILSQLKLDMNNNDPSIKQAISELISRKKGKVVKTDFFDINIIQLDDEDFKVESSLNETILQDMNEYHEIIERALLTIGGRNQRILDMKYFNALTGFRENEVSLFEPKLSFLARSLNPAQITENFRNIINIKGFPSFKKHTSKENFNVEKFLEIRESKECKDFRNWLWSINKINEKELLECTGSFSQRVGEFIRTPKGKTLRCITGIGLGFLTGNILSSSIYGIVDYFLLEKIFPVEGPIFFLNKKLPTIFR